MHFSREKKSHECPSNILFTTARKKLCAFGHHGLKRDYIKCLLNSFFCSNETSQILQIYMCAVLKYETIFDFCVRNFC